MAARVYCAAMHARLRPGLSQRALTILAAAAAAIPLFHRPRPSPVPGFMPVGVALGASGLANPADRLPMLRAVTLERRAVSPPGCRRQGRRRH